MRRIASWREAGKGGSSAARNSPSPVVLAEARRHGKCAVAVSKLDRLSRDVHFISGLMAHRVPFVVAESGRTSSRSCCTFTPPLPSASAR